MIRIEIEFDETKFKYRNVARFLSAQKSKVGSTFRSLSRSSAGSFPEQRLVIELKRRDISILDWKIRIWNSIKMHHDSSTLAFPWERGCINPFLEYYDYFYKDKG